VLWDVVLVCSYLQNGGIRLPSFAWSYYINLSIAVAMYYAINPNSFKTRFINVEVETDPGLCFGRTVCDKFGTLKKE